MTLIAGKQTGKQTLTLGSPPAGEANVDTREFACQGLQESDSFRVLTVGRGFLQRTAADTRSKMRPHMMMIECHWWNNSNTCAMVAILYPD